MSWGSVCDHICQIELFASVASAYTLPLRPHQLRPLLSAPPDPQCMHAFMCIWMCSVWARCSKNMTHAAAHSSSHPVCVHLLLSLPLCRPCCLHNLPLDVISRVLGRILGAYSALMSCFVMKWSLLVVFQNFQKVVLNYHSEPIISSLS